MIPGKNSSVPKGSSCKMRVLTDLWAVSFSGVCRNRRIPANVTNPIGK
jgi:hypothetical protein